MTTLDLRSAPRDDLGRLSIGQGGGYVPLLHQSGNVPVPSFVVDIKREILLAVRAGGVVSRTQIASAVGRKKTTWLIAHIEELVARGWLKRHQCAWKNGVVMYYYEVQR